MSDQKRPINIMSPANIDVSVVQRLLGAPDECSSRGFGRSAPVTPWRRELAGMADQMAGLIQTNADPEDQYRAAREAAEDLVEAVKQSLRQKYGRVFDTLLDGRSER